MRGTEMLAVGGVESLAEEIITGRDSHLRLRRWRGGDGEVGAEELVVVDIRHRPVQLWNVGEAWRKKV